MSTEAKTVRRFLWDVQLATSFGAFWIAGWRACGGWWGRRCRSLLPSTQASGHVKVRMLFSGGGGDGVCIYLDRLVDIVLLRVSFLLSDFAVENS